MKKSIIYILISLISACLYGQAPEKINYQAVVRDANFNTIKVKWGSSNSGNGIGGSNSVSMTQSYEKITVVLVDYYNGNNYYSLHKAQQP